jgi:sec-independent protein translocase protein TatC
MDEMRMPITDHLRELRARLIICIAAVLLMTMMAYAFCPSVFYPIIRAPLDTVAHNPNGNPFVVKVPLRDWLLDRYWSSTPAEQKQAIVTATQLHHTSFIDPFIMRLKVSLLFGIIIALPVIVFEAWAFIAAGLRQHERRYAMLYAPISLLLFFAGVSVAYFLVMPLGMIFLLEQGSALDLKPTLMLKEYVPFIMWPLLGFGVIFQMPLVALFGAKIGLLKPEMLTRHRPHAIVAMFVVAAILTPPDPFTQLAMAVPMLLLYEVSVLVTRHANRPAPDRVTEPQD